MSWQSLVALRVVLAYLINPILTKQQADKGSSVRRIRLQFTFALLLCSFLDLPTGLDFCSTTAATIGILGMLNSIARYAQWKAVRMSLSKTSLLMQGDDIIAITLGYVVLGETKYLQGLLLHGTLLAVGAWMLYALTHKPTTAQATNSEYTPKSLFYCWVLTYSMLWGLGMCSHRYFNLHGVPVELFIPCWYAGSLLGSYAIAATLGYHRPSEIGPPLHLIDALYSFAAATVIWKCLVLQYQANGLAPIAVTQPVYQVSEMIFPTLIGLYVFREGASLNRRDLGLFGLGLIGAVMIGLAWIGP